jgi:spore germination protein GerM
VSHRASFAIAGLVVALLAGCGLRADDSPQEIAARDIPAELLDPNPSSSTTLSESAGTTTVPVYMLKETSGAVRLVPVEREVTQASVPNERLAALFLGATAEEADRGIASGIPADTVLLDVTTDEEADEVVIDVSSDIFSIEGEALAQAFAQMVWTATERGAGGFRQVRFSVDGEPTPVLDGEGAEIEGPVTRQNYDAFTPRG